MKSEIYLSDLIELAINMFFVRRSEHNKLTKIYSLECDRCINCGNNQVISIYEITPMNSDTY